MGAKISSITVTITETDIMANIREFVHVEGLTFNNVEFEDKSIEITGNYHKVIDIPFLMRIKVEDVHNNKIRIIIEKIKALRIGVPNAALMGIINLMKGKLEPFGVDVNGNEIIIDADVLLEKVDHVHLMIDNILMENGVLAVKISAITADVQAMKEDKEREEEYENSGEKELDEKREEFMKKNEEARYMNAIASMGKPRDEYQNLRREIKERVPEDYDVIFEYAAAVPDIFALAWRVMKDRRVMTKDKIIIGVTGGYFLSPIDILPDRLPFLGKMDDLALFAFGVNYLLTRIPYPILAEHWSGDLETLDLIRDNLSRLTNMAGAGMLEKVFGYIEKPLDNKFGTYRDDSYYLEDGNIATFNPVTAVTEEDLIIRPV